MHPHKPLSLVAFLTIVAGIVFVVRYGSQGTPLQEIESWIRPGFVKEKAPMPAACEDQLDWLDIYNFTNPIRYVSRDIITKPVSSRPGSDRPSLTILDEPLFLDLETADLSQSKTLKSEKCLPPLILEVPHVAMPAVDASNMIFGLQTTIQRLNDTAKHLARWLPNTNARLFAIVIDLVKDEETPANDQQMAALEKEFHDKGMNVSIIHPVHPDHSLPQRSFSLVDVMYQARDNKTEWVICIDEDTFFPSMYDLQAMLSAHDLSKEQYLGSLSEDWWSVNHYGLMAFGGAGILLSSPLAKVVHDHNDDCIKHLRTTSGDISIMDCIYKYSTTKLTHIPGLHQLDMGGDVSGFYESGREMLSLHHWNGGWGAAFEMEKMHLVADICDSCFLQRWQFSNEMVLTNGFSIAHYPKGNASGKKPAGVLDTSSVDKINFNEMEQTWSPQSLGGDEMDVQHSLAPLRGKLPDDVKMGYKLLDSMYIDSDPTRGKKKDVVRQVYFNEGGEGEKDTVMVLNWRVGTSNPASAAPAGQNSSVSAI
ncbi:Uncharacterized protein BP5553_02136 [Venustampulla echinocandica]|uniref:Glycosyltransferase family 31 protein n=1 Tax=Venustampulla echinocandica TaxID=2656787 RepID=A0A370U305_9HELO|nr:Uncharacterized protein BP5553_02136 [Venustampulla echinocandica]RDL42157.1 Uncharacterized protein BP5553_02136 [Venustampulla echinocandica]